MNLLIVVGARPNFMKISPLIRALEQCETKIKHILVHTGQHFDYSMSQVFFDELGMPRPDINLEVGAGSHAWQTAEIMKRFEPVLVDYKPDWVILPGDVNSTIACALVASKMGISVAHLEAGLRSFDRSMPEEINRLLTDQLSDLLLIPSLDAKDNLLGEGVAEDKVHFVGNAMIDTLVRLLPKAEARWENLRDSLGVKESYILCTLHRPANVDHLGPLIEIITALQTLAKDYTVMFPVHPRTNKKINDAGLITAHGKIKLLEPLGYLDFLALQRRANLVITDSGGIQEETTYLNIPCLTVRPNTERPVTITQGTNTLVQAMKEDIVKQAVDKLQNFSLNHHSIPELWDGHTGERIVQIFKELM